MKSLITTAALWLAFAAGLHAEEAASLSQPMAEVVKLRGHEFKGPVQQKKITREQLREYLLGELQNELPIPLADYLRVLRSLHLLDNSPEPVEKLIKLYEAQVLAFYDPKTHIYYSLDRPPEGFPDIPAMEQMVVIHELTHALQDQVFGAGATMVGLRGKWDRQLAYQALLEGEATLIMFASVFEKMGLGLDKLASEPDLAKTIRTMAAQDTSIPEGTPRYFVESIKFPYFEGLLLAMAAYQKGGWAAVDRLHATHPSTSEQIYHPAEYLSDSSALRPIPVPPDAAGKVAGKRMVEATLGEFHWRFLLGEKAAAGWGGDSVRVTEDKRNRMTVLANTLWDTRQDAQEFARAYREFLEGRGERAEVRIEGTAVRVGYGNDRKQIARFIRGMAREQQAVR